jgi:hypothetical protein
MVIQVNDTPKNREAMKRMYESARSFVGPVEGNLGVMKLETVTLESWARSGPIPLENRELSQPPSVDNTNPQHES